MLKACLVHRECRVLKVFQGIKAHPDVTEGMGFLEGMVSRARQDQRAKKGRKESKENQARWGHLVKMACRESPGHQAGKGIRVIQARGVNRARRVTEASRAKEAAQGHQVREEHLEKEVVQEIEDSKEYKDCKAYQYTAYLLTQDVQVASA